MPAHERGRNTSLLPNKQLVLEWPLLQYNPPTRPRAATGHGEMGTILEGVGITRPWSNGGSGTGAAGRAALILLQEGDMVHVINLGLC